ncbi:MAG: hypothetical protein ACRDTC_19295 [Pseudonocardiaceae bacterium]
MNEYHRYHRQNTSITYRCAIRTERSSMSSLSIAETKHSWRAGPYMVAIPFTVIVYALSLRSTGLGAVGVPIGAAVGLGWALLLGFIAARVGRHQGWNAKVEDALVFVGVIATAFLLCGGIMASLLIGGALNEPSTTYETLSALMFPTLPYFIISNSLMELFVIPAIVFFGWRSGTRRILLLWSVAAYFAMRVWTYLVYAENRIETATGALSAEDVQWYKDTLAVDYRPVLIAVMLILLLLAAFLPARSWASRSRRS